METTPPSARPLAPLACDVLVAGGGTAGTAAAIAAARAGAKTILIEEGNCLGGVSTAGGVNEWYAHLDGLGSVLGDVTGLLKDQIQAGRFFNGEILKMAWLHLARQAGVQVFYHASLIGVDREDRRIRTVTATSLSRMLAFEARFFIDATGEGDLSFHAGCDFQQGDPEHGRTLHMTLTAHLFPSLSDVVPFLPPGVDPIEREDELPGLRGGKPLPDGKVYLNMTKVMGLDPTDPASLSKAEDEARIQLLRVVHFLQRSRLPRHALGATGSRIGIREGRRIRGESTLTADDILRQGGRTGFFEDGIAVGTCQIDFHSLTRAGHGGWREKVAPYGIPFGALRPKGVDNLLVAGKCISTDQVAHSSVRMTPTVCAMGQAAGTAAALAVRHGASSFADLDVGKLRARLTEDGMELDPAKHLSFAPELSPDPSAAK